MDKTVLISFPIAELQGIIVDCVNSCLKYNNQKTGEQANNSVQLLTREEAAELLQVDLSTLWLWTKKGKLKAYGIGNRVYYKRSEIDSALIPINDKKKGGNNE